MINLKKIEKERVKIDKVENCYDFFVAMLNAEDEKLQTDEHLWVLGIDRMGYAVCGYIVTLGYSNFYTVEARKLFRTAVVADAVKIVICQNKYNKKELELNEKDLDIINSIYYKAEIVGLKLIDHIIISNLSINSSTPLYYSYLEHGLMDFILQDVKYKIVSDVRTELEQYGKNHSSDLFKIRKEQIVARLMDINIGRKTIMEITNISESEVNEIKKRIKNDDNSIYM